MPAYVVEVARRANGDISSLSTDAALRIARKMRELTEDPGPRGDTIKRLVEITPVTYRLRIGDYRAIFRVDGNTVRVLRIVHRSELIRALKDLL